MSQTVITPILSPCIGVCMVDDDGFCMGCYRSLDEIAAWSTFDDQQRDQIMSELEQRGHAALNTQTAEPSVS